MPDGPDIDDDDLPEALANEFLPPPLSDHWVVLPKRLLQWAAVNIMLLGAAIGSLLTGLAATFIPVAHLSWGVFGLLGLTYLVRKFLITPVDEAAIDEARKALGQSDSPS